MNSLGIYFGPSLISIVETKGKKIVNSIKIPQSAFAAGELEEKVPEELKIVAAFKDELRKNKVAVKEAALALSGKDLIIRTFEMPVLSGQDMAAAITFEARKYIPFKIEELILDYQLCYDKAGQKNLVLLVGVKRETLDKYISIFKQLNLKLAAIEYAAFSNLRLLQLAGLIKGKEVFSIVAADLKEADEINFTVMEDGFPLFSRDIILGTSLEAPAAGEEADSGMLVEKLKTEVRISLDYYQRKFPAKKVAKTLFIISRDYQPDLDNFAKELGLAAQFMDVNKYLDKPLPFSLGFLKGYSSSLVNAVKSTLKIDILKALAKTERKPAVKLQLSAAMFKGLNLSPKALVFAVLICLAVFGFGLYQKIPLQKEIVGIRNVRPQVATISPQADLEELNSIDSQYKEKAAALDSVIRDRLYLTEPLNAIPRLVPEGMWLENFSFANAKDKRELLLEGSIYLADANKEFETVNAFLDKLKADPVFAKYFSDIKIVSLDSHSFRDFNVTRFSIYCGGAAKAGAWLQGQEAER